MRLRREFTGTHGGLRVWPVGGNSDLEIWTKLGKFFDDYLEIPAHELNVQNHVKSYGRRLARHVSKRGQPTAGLQLEVPPEHLAGVIADLTSHGYALRQTHGAGL